MKKKKTDLGLLFKTMGAYKITLVISVIFAALSAVVNIYAYTYIYKAADEIVSHLTDMSGLDNELLKNCGKAEEQGDKTYRHSACGIF